MPSDLPRQVDQTLARLRADSTALAQSLLDVENDPTYTLLNPAELAGATAARARLVRDRVASLWERYLPASELLRRAVTLRGDRARLGGVKAQELARLLHVPTTCSTPAGPDPAVLLEGTTELVAEVRADLDAIASAWTAHLTPLTAAERQLTALAATLDRIGLAGVPEMTAAGAAMDRASAAVASDPLSVTATDLAAVADAVRVAAETISSYSRAHDSLDDDLAAAGGVLAAIGAAASEGEMAARTVVERVTGSTDGIEQLPDGWFDHPRTGLRTRLDRMAAGPGDWRQAARDLMGWRADADALLARARRVAEVNAAPLRKRNELRGLLSALRAKAGRRDLSEDPDVEVAYERARDALFTAPVDLVGAEDLVRSYAPPERPPTGRTGRGRRMSGIRCPEDCDGTIEDGYCNVTGLAYTSSAAMSSAAMSPAAAIATAPSRSTGPSRRTGPTGSSSHRRGLGAGLVEVPAVEVRDPSSLVRSRPLVPEHRRFCVKCEKPVGRGRDGQPGRVRGFCANCGHAFSFVPALSTGDKVGPYEIAGAIAHGGQGWVYLARDRGVADDFWVVLKGVTDQEADYDAGAGLPGPGGSRT